MFSIWIVRIRHFSLRNIACHQSMQFIMGNESLSHRFLTHDIGFVLQPGIIIYRHAVDDCRWRYSPSHLLGNMPCFVGEVFFLTGGNMNVCPLGVGKCLHGSGFRTVVMYTHIVHRETRKALDSCLQIVRHSRVIRSRDFCSLGCVVDHVRLTLEGFALR